MELKSFTVKKSSWLRGEGGKRSYLLRFSDQKMCCLGFASLACGLSKDDIGGVRRPSAIYKFSEKYPQCFLDSNLDEESPYIFHIMNINDKTSLSDEERILKLQQKFQELGIDIKFED